VSIDALPCIACGRELKNVDVDVEGNQPYAATAFTTRGHYGSTAYDPMDGHYLEINVCDLCLVLHADRAAEGRDARPVVEDGVQIGMEPIRPPLRLVPWRVDAKLFAFVVKQTRAAFWLVDDDEPEDVLLDPDVPGSVPESPWD
jgi:hypothetical protein